MHACVRVCARPPFETSGYRTRSGRRASEAKEKTWTKSLRNEKQPPSPAAPCPSVDEPVLEASHTWSLTPFVSGAFGDSRFTSGGTATVFHGGRSVSLPAGRAPAPTAWPTLVIRPRGSEGLRRQLTVGSVSISLTAERVFVCLLVIHPTAVRKHASKPLRNLEPAAPPPPPPTPRPPGSQEQKPLQDRGSELPHRDFTAVTPPFQPPRIAGKTGFLWPCHQGPRSVRVSRERHSSIPPAWGLAGRLLLEAVGESAWCCRRPWCPGVHGPIPPIPHPSSVVTQLLPASLPAFPSYKDMSHCIRASLLHHDLIPTYHVRGDPTCKYGCVSGCQRSGCGHTAWGPPSNPTQAFGVPSCALVA
ncbi:uncharacterized protein LOC121021545 [Herpailurus yagouaroundi]|uniref:uncharacterized protein LOC121021545 n=1 Tax=Herpailurus yagouaroundi TaxID=1608482 RepID=UPI001AD62848|nr:uncharacterized protein LOC121021545 [Puma yagouaroundi]